ncbi:MAG: type II toxin-antitoxin system RelE/ParE family toxin [Bryobacterales bacterium]|nr:type II toxin-antitoxin system RelE/ParE family toxin [Bryobacterales bacterium]
MSRYVVRPKADQDLDGQAYYYAAEVSPEAGRRFLVAAHNTFALLATQPKMGWRCRTRVKRQIVTYGIISDGDCGATGEGCF